MHTIAFANLQRSEVFNLNCSHWVEHFTVSEYNHEEWHLFFQNNLGEEFRPDEPEIPEASQLFQIIPKEFACLNLI